MVRGGRFHQIGIVVIEDDVEIGSMVSGSNSIRTNGNRAGYKIDNLVQIAHNVTIGPDGVLCGQVGVQAVQKLVLEPS